MTTKAKKRRTGLEDLPREVFDATCCHLRVEDKYALTVVSKTIRALAEPNLYSAVSLKDQSGFLKLSHVLAARPYLCKAIRTYRLNGDVGWWCLDPLNELKSLSKFSFRPHHSEHTPSEPTIHMLKKLATEEWAHPALKQCTHDVPVTLELHEERKDLARLLIDIKVLYRYSIRNLRIYLWNSGSSSYAR